MTGKVVFIFSAVFTTVVAWAAVLTGGGLWGLGFAMGYVTGVAFLALAILLHRRERYPRTGVRR